ncbi:MAG TPA: glycosyltransferase family 4 protein [Steroidobacteraceae bacterium]|nr:glycosyltransferase family 4 protein [Steroidobacteraceae bacterium]
MSAVPKSMPARKPSICFLGLDNLPVLAREYNHHYIGGEPVQQTLLALAFARRGYPVSMVIADYGQTDGAQWQGVRTYKAYRPGAGMPVVRFIHPRWTGLWSALKRADADVYYTSCSGAQVGQLAMFCRQHGRKLIFRSASDADCDAELPLIKYWRDKQLYAYGLKRADAVLTQSTRQRHAMQANFGVDSTVASMLVDFGTVRAFAERDIDLLWVSNLRGLKRPELFLDLSEHLPRLRAHMVGGPMSAERGLFDAMQARAQQMPQVTFNGRIAYHDVQPFYERARILINTSDIEGFPNTYLQAWSCGVPVVSFFDPDRLIEREGLGRVPKNADEMRAAVDELTGDESAWQRASERCGAFMNRAFAENTVLATYERAVADVLGQRG